MKPDTLWGSVFPRLNIAGREMESGTDFVELRARGMEFGCFPSAVGSHWRVSMRRSTLSTDHAGSCVESRLERPQEARRLVGWLCGHPSIRETWTKVGAMAV